MTEVCCECGLDNEYECQRPNCPKSLLDFDALERELQEMGTMLGEMNETL